MTTREEIRGVESQVNALHRRIHETFATREKSRDHWERWEAACRDYHAYKNPTEQLGQPSILRDIRTGMGRWRDDALVFLEVDPWFFRSGYLKEKIVRALKQADLTMSEIERVNGILVTVVDSRKRREFREFCRLAVKVATPTLVAQLSQRETAPDAGVRSRAATMLSYIRKHRDVV
jgi:hypothetical protein